MGSQVYVHADYADGVVPAETLAKAKLVLNDELPSFQYNCLMYDTKTGLVRFDQAPDFDTAREPIPGDTVTVNPATSSIVARRYYDAIWHHKWLWVQNDYDGFSVEDSWEWSKKWLSTIRKTDDPVSNRGIANGTGHGTTNWNKQLDYFGLPHDENDSGKRFSLRTVEPVQPTSNKWQQGHTEAWFRENGFPIYQDVPLELQEVKRDTSKKGHGTQIGTTVNTYRQLFEKLQQDFPDDWQNMRVLDASSGLGLGTQLGREMGFNVTDIEPFPNDKYHPDYTDYSLLESEIENGETDGFDFIISNAVLNVVPQDTRDQIAVAMGHLLKPGGRMYVNVISKNYATAINSNPDIEEAKAKKVTARTMEGDYSEKGGVKGRGHEVFVWQSNSVQKVFSTNELQAYLEDALGDGYEVTPFSKFGMTAAMVEKSSDYSPDSRHSLRSDTIQDVYDADEMLDAVGDTFAVTGDDKAALNNYREAYKAYADIQRRIGEQMSILNDENVQGDERIKAQNRLGIFRDQLDRAYQNVRKASQTYAMRNMRKNANRFVDDFILKDDDLSRPLEDIVNELRDDLKITKAADTQKLMAWMQENRDMRKAFNDRMKRDSEYRKIHQEISKRRHKVQRMVRSVNDLLTNEQDYKNVPEQYKKLAEYFVSTIVINDAGGSGRIAFDKEQAQKLAKTYVGLMNTDANETGYVWDDEMQESLAAMQDAILQMATIRQSPAADEGGRNAKEMQMLMQWERIADVAEYVHGTVKHAGEVFINNQRQEIQKVANRFIEDNVDKKDKRYRDSKLANVMRAVQQFGGWGNLTPEYFFRLIGDETMSGLNENLHEAEQQYGLHLGQARDFFAEMAKKHNRKHWDTKKPLVLDTEGGKHVELTTQQAMSIYATWQREHMDGQIASQHLEKGGFVLPDAVKLGGRQTGTRLTAKDMQIIEAFLT